MLKRQFSVTSSGCEVLGETAPAKGMEKLWNGKERFRKLCAPEGGEGKQRQVAMRNL